MVENVHDLIQVKGGEGRGRFLPVNELYLFLSSLSPEIRIAQFGSEKTNLQTNPLFPIAG